MNEDTLVTGTTGTVGATPAPTQADGVDTPSTPMNLPADAKSNAVDGNKESIEKLANDLNAMKSTFQKREAALTREWDDREKQYKQQLEQLKVATMDDEQRKEYESTAAVRRLVEMEEALQNVAAQSEEAQSMLTAQRYFLSQGVPLNALNLEEGYDALWHSGMASLTAELENLRKQRSTSTAQQPSTITAPAVVTGNNAPASVGPNWSDLIKKYGDEETVYRLVETGQLSADHIPAIGKL